MLKPKLSLPVKLISGFIYHDEDVYSKTKEILFRRFGKIDFESNIINFNYTTYYNEELGSPLYRRFISFLKLIDPANLVKIKLFTIKIERHFSYKGKRRINIDPGYINLAKLVLSTTKDFYHRIYLKKGIYAEVTLYYKNKKFLDLPTTYPDYSTKEYKEIFTKIREIYKKQINLYLKKE